MLIQCTIGKQTQLCIHDHVTRKPSKTQSFALELKNFESTLCMKTFTSTTDYIKHVQEKHYDPANKKIDELGSCNPFLEKHIHFTSHDCLKIYLKDASYK